MAEGFWRRSRRQRKGGLHVFEALNKASHQNKYDVKWAEWSYGKYCSAVCTWLIQLEKSSVFDSGPAKAERMALADEFQRFLAMYKLMLEKRNKLRGTSPEVMELEKRIAEFRRQYRTRFGTDLPMLMISNLPSDVVRLGENLAKKSAKLSILRRKKSLIEYWLNGVRNFPKHNDKSSLMFQYLGNAESSKVRLFLDVLVNDAEKISQLEDPRPAVKFESDASAGLKTAGDKDDVTGQYNFTKVTWTDDEFKKAIKAEVGASYGVRASGACTIEITGLKAELKAEAFAGASFAAEAGATYGVGRGVELKGSVEAMIGVKIKLDATIDVADIFLIEASAEAFAGAMAKAEVEFKATINGVSFKIEAEAFAGARIKGKAGMTLRMFGYDIIKGEVEGFLAVGVGANFKLAFESSTFGGTKLEIGAGLVVGVGGGASGSFTIFTDNLARVANALFYTGYLTLMGESMKKHAWTEYFKNLEDNEILFKKANELMDQYIARCVRERDVLLAGQQTWAQLRALG